MGHHRFDLGDAGMTAHEQLRQPSPPTTGGEAAGGGAGSDSAGTFEVGSVAHRAARLRDVIMSLNSRLQNYLVETADWHARRPRLELPPGVYAGADVEGVRHIVAEFASDVEDLWDASPEEASEAFDGALERFSGLNRMGGGELGALAESLGSMLEVAGRPNNEGINGIVEQRSAQLEDAFVARVEALALHVAK